MKYFLDLEEYTPPSVRIKYRRQRQWQKLKAKIPIILVSFITAVVTNIIINMLKQ